MKKALLLFFFIVNAITSRAQKSNDPLEPIIKEPTADTTPRNNLYNNVEHEPSFPGGLDKLYKYLTKNLKYPLVAKENNIKGKVFVTFVVEKKGSLTNVKILRSLSQETDAEALRLIHNSPKWHPGIRHGRPVRVQYSLPIVFQNPNQ
jgi:protein TonB